MTFMNLLAMASPNGGGEGGGASSLLSFLPLVLIFVVFWFMIIRPQKKQQDQRKAMIEALKRGDQIVTSGGLFATVKDVKDDRVVATIAEGVKVEISKSAISGVVEESAVASWRPGGPDPPLRRPLPAPAGAEPWIRPPRQPRPCWIRLWAHPDRRRRGGPGGSADRAATRGWWS